MPQPEASLADSPVMMFSKHLQELPLAQAATEVRKIGIQRLDLTVRPKGHVEPEAVADALPEAMEILKQQGVGVGMITTGIIDATSPHTESILRTAARLGITHYKLGYFPYKGFGTLRESRTEAVARLKDLAELNLSLGIHGGYHNHSDAFIGASLWDVAHVLESIDPRAIGVYLDPAHATIEGGSGGWLMGLDLVAPRVTMLAVKDFRWVDGKHRYAGRRRHSVEFCPLADGNTDWQSVIRVLKQIGFKGPISFHGEYQGPHSFADLSVADVIVETGRDLQAFRSWMNAP